MQVRIDPPNKKAIEAIIDYHRRTFGRYKSSTEIANELLRDGLAASGQFQLQAKPKDGK